MDGIYEVLKPQVQEIITILLAGVLGYLAILARSAVKTFISKTEGFLDEQARQRLEVMFDNIIGSLEAQGKALTIDDVVNYAKKYNADDLVRLGLQGEKLASRVRTAINTRLSSINTVASKSPV